MLSLEPMGLFPALAGEGPGGVPTAVSPQAGLCSNDRRELEGVLGAVGDPPQSLNLPSSLGHREPSPRADPTHIPQHGPLAYPGPVPTSILIPKGSTLEEAREKKAWAQGSEHADLETWLPLSGV